MLKHVKHNLIGFGRLNAEVLPTHDGLPLRSLFRTVGFNEFVFAFSQMMQSQVSLQSLFTALQVFSLFAIVE